MPTALSTRDTTSKRAPPPPADASAAKPARQLRAPAWTCPRCGTRKRLRGDRRG